MAAFCVASLIVPCVGAAADYVVAVEKATNADPSWSAVVNELKAKHQAEVVVYDGNAKLGEILPALKKNSPKYVCFVTKPETAGRDLVVGAAQLLRQIDDDPYGDALWGIVTGYEAADAMRLAKAPKSRVVKRAASSQGGKGFVDSWEAGFSSDEGNKDVILRKNPGGKCEQLSTGGNPAKALAEAFNAMDVDYFITSGHATQHDWQIIYNKNEGSLVHDEEARLRFKNPAGEFYPMTRASPKIYIAAGNCLIGNIDQRACMATSWLHSGGAEQFCGYTCVTFFGFMGWGAKSLLEESRASFSQAFYLQNQLLIWKLLDMRDGKLATLPLPAEQFGNGRRVESFIQANVKNLVKVKNGNATLDHDALGYLWDRDIVAFYGDPAQHVWFPSERRSIDVQVKGAEVLVKFNQDMKFGELGDVKSARPVIQLLDQAPAGTKLVDAAGKPVERAVVNDRFLIVPVTGKHAKGETLKFKLVK